MGFHHIFGDAGRGLTMDQTTGVFEVDVTWFNEWMSRYVPTGEINQVDGTPTGQFMSDDYKTGVLLETRIKEKLNHGGYTGTGQDIWNNAESKIPLGGVSANNNTGLKIENNINLKLDHTNGIATHLECTTEPVHDFDVVRKIDLDNVIGNLGANVIELLGEINASATTITLTKVYAEFIVTAKDLSTGIYETSMTIPTGTTGEFATNDSERTSTVSINGHTSGSTIVFNNNATPGGDSLSFVVYGKMVESGAITIQQGPGILVEGLKVSHADTSNQSNIALTENQVVKDMSFDEFGHVVSVATGTVNPQWTDILNKPDFGVYVQKTGDAMSGLLSNTVGFTSPTTTCTTSLVLNGYTITVQA